MIVDLTRESLADTFSDLMGGYREAVDLGGGAAMPRGTMKSYAIEAAGVTSDAGARELLGEIASSYDGRVLGTSDPSMALMTGGGEVPFVVDSLDPRFWLLHTTAPAQLSQRFMRRLVRAQHRIDRCWFTWEFIRGLNPPGATRWFKSDFEGRAMHPPEGSARKLKIQLEGAGVDGLYEKLAAMEEYRHAAALTAVAADLSTPTGRVTEIAHFSGRFVAQGDSFHPHVTFVARALAQYRRVVEKVERDCTVDFASAGPMGGATLSGRPLAITFRPIGDMDRFLGELFSCREPFRLWGVPKNVAPNTWDTEAVDLHIGATLRVRTTPTQLVVTLPRTTCGNTALRLLTNIQHRYDAMATWDVTDDAADAA